MNLFKVIYWSTCEYNGTDTIFTHDDKSESDFGVDVQEAIDKLGSEMRISQIEEYLVSQKGYKEVPCKVHNTAGDVWM
jgi:hypothetical protein